jgi:catecholate siderophore receptor
MAHIKSRKHLSTTPLVAALAATLPLVAHAAPQQESVVQLPTIEVNAEQENNYKAKNVSSPKYTQELVNTTQTVQVIKKELLQEQGAASLIEALRNTPGITLQMGENGNTSAGDTFQMRGFSTQTSTYVDGIRDLGAVSRDVFNLEQIEVVKGPSGAEAGRGSASGYINLVSKLPQAKNSREISARYNTAENARLTADINQAISENTAIRLNVMGQDGGVEGRDVVENNAYAIAPSIAFGLNTNNRFYLYSQHVRQRNTPDGGIPTIGREGFFNADALLNAAPKVDTANYYGSANDYEDIDANMLSAKFESDFSDQVKFTNLSRYGKTTMDRRLTGIITLSRKDATGKDSADPKDWTISRSRQGVDQENEILANTSTLNLNFKTGTITHDTVVGLELLREQQHARTLSAQKPGVAAPTIPHANLYHPNAHDALPALMHTGAYSDGATDTAALYVFDTLKFLNDRVQLNGGVRVDYYDTDYDALTISTAAATAKIPYEVTTTKTDLTAHDTLVSWKIGSLVKPTESSSVYVSYAKSLTPPGSANFGLSATGANSSTAKPQETHHYELGTKWDVLAQKLALTAAIYRTDNENQFTQDPVTKESLQEGKTQVKGVELGAVGQITDAWNLSAGIAHMKTSQENQRSINATTGAITTTNTVRWSPEWTASLWTTYNISGFKVGVGARYVDELVRANTTSSVPSATPTNMPKAPSYVVVDAMAGYTFNKNASLNLNLYNLADKEYISSLNNGGGRFTLGQPRSAALTLNYKF